MPHIVSRQLPLSVFNDDKSETIMKAGQIRYMYIATVPVTEYQDSKPQES